MELIRPIVKVGNSAGVILPKEWLKGKARIELIEKPLDIKQEIFTLLKDYLEDIIGIYLVGSYARGEETSESDIDVLVITNKTNKKVEQGKYNIILISKEKFESGLKDNIFPILPMIIESRPLLNSELISKYKNIELTERNLSWHISTTKSIIKVLKEKINLEKENGLCSDSVAYSLILRLRGEYILDCIIKGKIWKNKEFLSIIKEISGSLEAYSGYLRLKNNKKQVTSLPLEQAEKLLRYLEENISQQEKWVKKKIEKSIEGLEKSIEEHKQKIREYSGKNEHLVNYWEKEIESLQEKKNEKKGKLKK